MRKQFNESKLSDFLIEYLSLAEKMGKTEIAYEAVAGIPPSEALNSKDSRVDLITSMCEQSLLNSKQFEEPTIGGRRVA